MFLHTKIWLMFLTVISSVEKAFLLDNGLVKTPPMGWMSWGYYMCSVDCLNKPNHCLDEKLILSVADAFFHEGYQEAGYEYIIIDDCWSEKTRDNHGRLVPDRKRFPRGMKFLADYIHSKGLKFGMYTNIAAVTCMGYPGSRDYFAEDAAQFASWGVDYLKVDGCFVEELYLHHAYIDLGRHLKATGRPMVYACSWPYYMEFIHKQEQNISLVEGVCNVYRNYHDVALHWGSVKAIASFYQQRYTHFSGHHGAHHWNDPDMLIVGTGALSLGQSRVQLAVWAALSAPLLLSCDVTQVTSAERRLLLNLELLAIAQDPAAVMAKPHPRPHYVTVWVKPVLPTKGDLYHSYAIAIVNLGEEHREVSLRPRDYGLNYTDQYSVMDVWSRRFLPNVTSHDTITVIVPAGDAALYSLFPL